MAGCCYGRPTESAIGIAFTHSHYAPNGIKLIPTQLISSAGMFVIAGILFYYGRKKRIPGKISALYLLQYTCRNKGKTVVVITHNQALTAMADRVITVKNGTVTSMNLNEHIVDIEQIEW